MKEITGNIWDYYTKFPESVAVITTNGGTGKHGAIMGAGIAKQAAERFNTLKRELGKKLVEGGNQAYYFPHLRLITFPVKEIFWEMAQPGLIEISALELVKIVNENKIEQVFLPRPGCNNGRLTWENVKPLLFDVLDERFTVVELEWRLKQ